MKYLKNKTKIVIEMNLCIDGAFVCNNEKKICINDVYTKAGYIYPTYALPFDSKSNWDSINWGMIAKYEVELIVC